MIRNQNRTSSRETLKIRVAVVVVFALPLLTIPAFAAKDKRAPDTEEQRFLDGLADQNEVDAYKGLFADGFELSDLPDPSSVLDTRTPLEIRVNKRNTIKPQKILPEPGSTETYSSPLVRSYDGLITITDVEANVIQGSLSDADGDTDGIFRVYHNLPEVSARMPYTGEHRLSYRSYFEGGSSIERLVISDDVVPTFMSVQDGGNRPVEVLFEKLDLEIRQIAEPKQNNVSVSLISNPSQSISLQTGETKSLELSDGTPILIHLAYSHALDPDNPLMEGLPYFIDLKIYRNWK